MSLGTWRRSVGRPLGSQESCVWPGVGRTTAMCRRSDTRRLRSTHAPSSDPRRCAWARAPPTTASPPGFMSRGQEWRHPEVVGAVGLVGPCGADFARRRGMSDRVVVIGNPESVFVQAPVRYWRRRGIDAVILAPRWHAPDVGDGLPVISAEAVVPHVMRRVAEAMVPLLTSLDQVVAAADPARASLALRSWGPAAAAPSLVPPVRDALLVAAAVDAVQPVAVLGHEVFAFGPATQLSVAPRRSLFVWGADVLHYAHTSDAALSLVRGALLSADYVFAGSETMRDTVHAQFGVPRDRVVALSYGVDRTTFRPASRDEASRTRATYGIPEGAPVVMNLRRFREHWGASCAADATLALLGRRHDVHVVLVEGAVKGDAFERVLALAVDQGVRDRIVAVRGHAPLDEMARLMALSDVSWSLVRSLEPLSWSVLQAAASGSGLIISDQETYRQARADGLRAALVAGDDRRAIVEATLDRLDDGVARVRDAAANARYVSTYHDHDRAMERLLRLVTGGLVAERLLRRVEAPNGHNPCATESARDCDSAHTTNAGNLIA